MTSTVYPDSVTPMELGKPVGAPILLNANEAMFAFVPVNPLFGPSPADGNPTSFIRIAMSGPVPANALSVEVKASNIAANTIGNSSGPVTQNSGNMALDDGTGVDAAGAYFASTPLANVVLLKIVSHLADASNLKAYFKITNTTGVARKFVWVAADNDAESQQPWIDVSATALTFDALTNENPNVTAQGYTVTNYGTGPATLGAFAPALATPYSVVADVNGKVVAPAGSVAGSIGFSPAATGPAPGATVTLASNDGAAGPGPGHNNQIQLSGSAKQLEIAFMLDDSGSMGNGPDGGPPASGNRRLDQLQAATSPIFQMLATFANGAGKFGMLSFPGKNVEVGNNLKAYELLPSAQIGALTDAINAVNGLTAAGGTPMDYALQRALLPDSATFPAFFSAAPADHNDSRWILLMSDGAWNIGANPKFEVGKLVGHNIKVFTIGFGTAGQVDHQTLEDIANQTGGKPYEVTVGSDFEYNQLASNFKKLLLAAYPSLSAAADPNAVYYFGAPPNVHPIVITPYDGKAAFLINWNAPQAGRLTLALQTPWGDTLDAGSAAAGKYPGVTFSAGPRHAMFTVAREYFDGEGEYFDGEGGRNRFGVWSMLVGGARLGVTETAIVRGLERYSYDCILESSLRLAAEVGTNNPSAGDEIEITARPTLRGLPLVGATVTAEVSGPGISADNWLAAIPITQAEYNAAKEKLGNSDSSPLYVKSFIAQNRGLVYDPATRSAKITLTDADGTGVYRASFFSTQTPGAYSSLVSAQGQTPDGVAYLRQTPANVVASVKPNPAFTLWDWSFTAFGDRTTLVLTFTPRDAFGNVVLLDPGHPGFVNVTVQGAATPVQTLFDGAYSATITYPSAAPPTISVSVLGVPLVAGAAPPNPATLYFANRVYGFRTGLEGAPRANQHVDPSAALGDIRSRGSFVSLGAYGVLTLGVNGAVALGGDEHDVVVFVQPDADRRPYRVEAQDADGDEWVVLGHSPGTTQAFRLPRRLRAASAVRITDTSGRTRVGGALSPTPGVSIRGVGFARVAAAHYCLRGLECCEKAPRGGREGSEARGV